MAIRSGQPSLLLRGDAFHFSSFGQRRGHGPKAAPPGFKKKRSAGISENKRKKRK
jgi:hypothetical protein